MRTPDPRRGSVLTSLPLFGGLGLLLVLQFAGPGTANAAWTGESLDQQVSFDDNEYARGVQVVLDPSGTLHSLWLEDSPSTREVLYGRSTDAGATWSSATGDREISLPDGNAAYEECAIAVGDGLLVVVWSEDLVGTREVHFGTSTDGGLTFSSETSEAILSDPNSAVDTFVPSVTVESDNTIHVVWHQSNGETAEIHYSRSTDGGATWSGTSGDRVISFPDGNGASDPKIMLGTNGRLVVVWKENSDSGGRVLQVGISDDGGDTWSSETSDREISQPVNLMTNIDAASGLFGSRGLYAIYAGSFDESSPFHYETYVTSSTDNGDSWSGESVTIPVSFDEDHTRSTSNPDVFYSVCGDVIVAWNEEEDVAGTAEIHISELSGGSWSGATEDIVISFPDGENGYRPSIAGVEDIVILPSSGGGDPVDTWILWTEFEGGATDNYEVHTSAAYRCDTSTAPSPEAISPLSLTILPNPSNGPVRIEMALASYDGGRLSPGDGSDVSAQTEDVGHIEIFDAGGRQIVSRSVELTDGRASLVWDPSAERSSLSAGVYFVRARSASAEQMRTLVIR